MNRTPRLLLAAALAVIFLSAACGAQAGGVPAQGTTPPVEETGTAATPAGITPGTTAVSPAEIWGQYCARELPITVLTIPENASFEVVPPSAATPSPDNPAICESFGTFQDRQIVVCRAPISAVLTLNVCEGANCTQQQVGFETCPLFPGGRPSDTPAFTPTSAPTSSPLPAETPTP